MIENKQYEDTVFAGDLKDVLVDADNNIPIYVCINGEKHPISLIIDNTPKLNEIKLVVYR